MNQNPPPVIVLYKQSLNDAEKKNFSKLWQQEPIEVKEVQYLVKQFFSNLFQALKNSKDAYTPAMFEQETSDHFSEISDIQSRNQTFFSEQSNSIQEILHIMDFGKLTYQSAFLEYNSMNSIALLCERMKAMNVDQSLNEKIDQSFFNLSKLRK